MYKLILVFACAFGGCVKPPEHVSVSDKSIEVYAATITSSNLAVLSIGGFYLHSKVENLYLDLEYKGALTNKEAKERICSYISGMLEHINKDIVLLPFLEKPVFTAEDISVSLSYLSTDGDSAQVHLYDGQVIFSLYDKKTNSLHTTHQEPFAAEYAQK